ncbi:MAG: alkaline phosphatase PhoX, partial [Rubrobacter sp.]
MGLTRGRFLKQGVAATGAMAAGLPLFVSACGRESAEKKVKRPDYGPLVEAGPELELPEGFRYVVISREGDPMSDGLPTPGIPDGTAAFPRAGGKLVLVRNHELFDPGEAIGPDLA